MYFCARYQEEGNLIYVNYKFIGIFTRTECKKNGKIDLLRPFSYRFSVVLEKVFHVKRHNKGKMGPMSQLIIAINYLKENYEKVGKLNRVSVEQSGKFLVTKNTVDL